MNGTRNKTKKVKEEAFPAFPGSKKRDVQKADEEERDNVTNSSRSSVNSFLEATTMLPSPTSVLLLGFLREELLPMLYETVVLNEKDSRWCAVVSGNAMTRKPFKFTKYLIADLSIQPSLLVFPKLVVFIPNTPKNTCPHHGPQLATDSLTIFKSVHTMTVSSLLHTLFPRRTTTGTRRRAVEHVSAVTVADSAFVLGTLEDEDVGYIFTSETDRLTTEFNFEHKSTSKRLGHTISQLLWLTMSSKDSVDDDESDEDNGLSGPKLNFNLYGTLDAADLVTKALKKLLWKEFFPSVNIQIASEQSLPFHLLEASVYKAAAIYERVWRRLIEDFDADDDIPWRQLCHIEVNVADDLDATAWGSFNLQESGKIALEFYRIQEDGNEDQRFIDIFTPKRR
ncbi:hypothetical protein QFC21_006074 [Naganishia friedmannii]|uniref:Uncharacterized protein n=1 Tax=Naganishia friedmannii TaxID=89922 RepID=A0ACC2V551_9TREE|nr:hypothetical protein QFC21_006074 [Naganishia friedmannii]